MVSKVTKDGRIVLWEGGSLWAFDVLADHEGRSNRMHAHHAVQLTLSAGGDVGIRTADGLIPGPVILTAPDVPHAIEPRGRIALIFVDPESRMGARLKALLDGRPALPLPGLPGRESRLAHIWDRPAPTDLELVALGQGLLASLLDAARADHHSGIDNRIQRVIDRLKDPEATAMTLSEAAGVACLSESRFSHLFVDQVGLPFRTYLLWRRLSIAVHRMAAGASLTSAAHEAGFADSAHFSRTFLRMFGIPASVLTMI